MKYIFTILISFSFVSNALHRYSTKLISMRKLTATLCLTLTVLLGSMGCGADLQKGVNDAFYTYKNGKFFTDEGEVPLGCFSELMIQLNGDDIVAAVYLDRTVLRGCITSNKHVLEENNNYRLFIEKEKKNDVFWIRICETNSGSMGQYCDKIIIQFVKRRYLTSKGDKDVISIEKLGEWK